MSTIMPVYIPLDNSSHNTDIAICQSLPTKAETLICLENLKKQENMEVTFGIGFVIILIVLLLLFIRWID